jgi:hypothetical protein
MAATVAIFQGTVEKEEAGMSKANSSGTAVDVSIAPMLSVRRGARAVES